MRRRLGLFLGSVAIATVAAATPPERWIHVAVSDPGNDERVQVHLPLALVQEILPHINHERLRAGRVRIEHADFGDHDVKAIWKAVAEAREGRYVTVEGTEGNVKVSRFGGYLLVDVDDPGDPSTVKIKVPVKAVDALFAPGGDELDLLAAIGVLAGEPDGDLVTVKDGDETVRIWIDSSAAPE